MCTCNNPISSTYKICMCANVGIMFNVYEWHTNLTVVDCFSDSGVNAIFHSRLFVHILVTVRRWALIIPAKFCLSMTYHPVKSHENMFMFIWPFLEGALCKFHFDLSIRTSIGLSVKWGKKKTSDVGPIIQWFLWWKCESPPAYY